jgi:hypothetical protein
LDRDEVRDASSFRAFVADFTTSYTDGRHDRYQWLNLAAYKEHGTFEVRSHSGTLNASKASNWVVAHIRFIDAVAAMTVDEVFARFAGNDAQSNFAALAEIWADGDLTDYYAGRAAKFGTYYTQAAGAELAAADSEYSQELAARPNRATRRQLRARSWGRFAELAEPRTARAGRLNHNHYN